MPSGLTLDPATRIISGTPAVGSGKEYTVTVTATSGNKSDSKTFKLTVNEAPSFTSATSTTFTTSAYNSFTVTARGWPKPTFSVSPSFTNNISFDSLSGVISGYPSSTATQGVTITASNGIGTAATQSFTLYVSQATSPYITSHPSDVTVYAGGNVSFYVSAYGSPSPSYRWQCSTDGGSTYYDVYSNYYNYNYYYSDTSPTLTLNNVSSSDNGKLFRCVVSNSAGTVYSNAARLTVTGSSSGTGTSTGTVPGSFKIDNVSVESGGKALRTSVSNTTVSIKNAKKNTRFGIEYYSFAQWVKFLHPYYQVTIYGNDGMGDLETHMLASGDIYRSYTSAFRSSERITQPLLISVNDANNANNAIVLRIRLPRSYSASSLTLVAYTVNGNGVTYEDVDDGNGEWDAVAVNFSVVKIGKYYYLKTDKLDPGIYAVTR